MVVYPVSRTPGASQKIIALKTSTIKYDQNGQPFPFTAWRDSGLGVKNAATLLPIGSSGVLYPPHALDKQFGNVSLFSQLAPKADDLWFKAMALLQGTFPHRVKETPKPPIPIMGSQKIALKKDNIGLDKNTSQWQALSDYFNLYELIYGKKV